jgi:hypothetical protein
MVFALYSSRAAQDSNAIANLGDCYRTISALSDGFVC